ncbi:hypothetical protein DPMN_126345 [Dreissena polymorpha]|uniref:Uncharacterized protein n=1 Tax=Dreissena polymorpha TaxID=45954 RepID=A0A9D4JY18_DREPO|nr:hypothetical protein DPMN_126345 [Dreissena polymorpha]
MFKVNARTMDTGPKKKAQTKLPENQETREKDPPGGHVFLPFQTIFKLNCHWAKNVSSRLFTCFPYIHIEKTAQPSGGNVFPPIMTIFELVRDIYKIDVYKTKMMIRQKMKMTPPPPPGGHKTHVLIKFHDDWTKNLTSRVFTCFHFIHIDKTAPPPGGHFFSPIWTISDPSEISMKPMF